MTNTSHTATAVAALLMELLMDLLEQLGRAKTSQAAHFIETQLRAIATAARAAVHLKALTTRNQGSYDEPLPEDDLKTEEMRAELERRIARIREDLDRQRADEDAEED